MKNTLVLVLISLCSISFGQQNPSKDKKGSNDSQKNASLPVELDNKKVDLLTQNNLSLKKELNDLKAIVKENNELILMNLFNKKYVSDTKYFESTDLEDEDTLSLLKYNALLKSIKYNCSDTEKKIANEALAFNDNYIKLTQIQRLFQVKYNEKNVNEAILIINNLSPLSNNISKLSLSKDKILKRLNNYEAISCQIVPQEIQKIQKNKVELDNNIKKFKELKSKPQYKEYPYVISVLSKFEKNPKLDVNDFFDIRKEKTDVLPEKTASSNKAVESTKKENSTNGTPTKTNSSIETNNKENQQPKLDKENKEDKEVSKEYPKK
jgi:hypothetical protein